jgi:hypothetical protein
MTITSAARRIAISETADPLDLLYERCLTLADRVLSGQLLFIDAVDMAYSAAEWSGLVDCFGEDLIQLVLADAFVGVRP